ncbi:MAG: hypothetical protein H6672_06305 [Anaerolineaceae bacterium]|nr:hypothetical protein [Anaerolineaceae bacterium]
MAGALLLAVLVFIIPVSAATAISCSGNLVVNASVWNTVDSDYRLNGTGPGLPTAARAILAGVTTPLTWQLAGPGTWNVQLELRNSLTGGLWTTSIYPITVTCKPVSAEVPQEIPYPNLRDGRINNEPTHDAAAPVVVYCADDNLDVYWVDPSTSQGRLVIRVVKVSGVPEDGTQILGSAGGVILYWLADGRYQINTTYANGKPYTINWNGCDSSTLEHQDA